MNGSRPCGWGELIEATIEEITVADDDRAPLLHIRGRYR